MSEGVRDYWRRRSREVDDPLLRGTVTDELPVVRLKDRLEKAHVARVVSFAKDMRALELGAGAGRFGLWLAERVGEVTLVDAVAAQLEVAREHAAARGLSNVRTVVSGAEDYVPEAGAYDLVLISGLLCHLDDDALARLVDAVADALAPGGRLVLKEPITSDGIAREDRRGGYLAVFRPREALAEAFARRLPLLYERPTLAHPIPFFLGGTNEASATVGGGSSGKLIDLVAPLWERFDPTLLAIEERLRATPGLSRLLAPVPVLQDLYVFGAPLERAAEGAPALSVVVIAYDEEECLEPVAQELLDALSREGPRTFELVLVDDGSSDATLSVMRRLAATDPRCVVVALSPNRGIGGALRAGFDAARGAHVTWVPADGQIAPDAVLELYRRRAEAPMLTTVYSRRDDPFYRTVISQTLNAIIRLRSGEVAKSGGNYLFERDAWERHAPDPDDSMMISTAFRKRLREASVPIVEVPIRARARVAGSSKVLNPRTIARTLFSALSMSRE